MNRRLVGTSRCPARAGSTARGAAGGNVAPLNAARTSRACGSAIPTFARSWSRCVLGRASRLSMNRNVGQASRLPRPRSGYTDARPATAGRWAGETPALRWTRPGSWFQCAITKSWRLPMNGSCRQQVLDCAGLLALFAMLRFAKRQRTAAVQGVVAPARAAFGSGCLWVVKRPSTLPGNKRLVSETG
jgi:hypothetical protein